MQCPDFPIYAYTGNTDEGFYNNDCYDDGDFNDSYNDQTYGDNYGYASWGPRRRPLFIIIMFCNSGDVALANISTFR